MEQGKPWAPAPRARVCGVHAGRPLDLFCKDYGYALCPALGPRCGHGVRLLTHAIRHKQELMALCLKDLEERKEQEAGNRRIIEQAANDLKGWSHPCNAVCGELEIEKEMQETRRLLEQRHPMPFSFEHILNHYKHFVTILQSILRKPLEAQL